MWGTRGPKPGREHWVNDDRVAKCFTCFAEFGMTRWKHHCRACGNVVCWKCSTQKIGHTSSTREKEADYSEKAKRVCDACFKNITRAKEKVAEISKETRITQKEAIVMKNRILTSIAKSEEVVQQSQELTLRRKREAIEVGWRGVRVLVDKSAQITRQRAELVAQLHAMKQQVPSVRDRISTLRRAWLSGQEPSTRLLAAADGDDGRARGDAGADTDAAATESSAPASAAAPGAYLVYEEMHHGTMSIVWSKGKIDHALAYGDPGKAVPHFYYNGDGKLELYRGITRNTQNFYVGWTLFVQICRQFECTVVVSGEANDTAPVPTTLWLHRKRHNEVQKVLPHAPFTAEGVDVVAAVHADSHDLDVPCMERGPFVQKTIPVGHFVAFDA